MFRQSRSHLSILGARGVILKIGPHWGPSNTRRHNTNTEVGATWLLAFVHPWLFLCYIGLPITIQILSARSAHFGHVEAQKWNCVPVLKYCPRLYWLLTDHFTWNITYTNTDLFGHWCLEVLNCHFSLSIHCQFSSPFSTSVSCTLLRSSPFPSSYTTIRCPPFLYLSVPSSLQQTVKSRVPAFLKRFIWCTVNLAL
jgi:hypothetical protein